MATVFETIRNSFVEEIKESHSFKEKIQAKKDEFLILTKKLDDSIRIYDKNLKLFDNFLNIFKASQDINLNALVGIKFPLFIKSSKKIETWFMVGATGSKFLICSTPVKIEHFKNIKEIQKNLKIINKAVFDEDFAKKSEDIPYLDVNKLKEQPIIPLYRESKSCIELWRLDEEEGQIVLKGSPYKLRVPQDLSIDLLLQRANLGYNLIKNNLAYRINVRDFLFYLGEVVTIPESNLKKRIQFSLLLLRTLKHLEEHFSKMEAFSKSILEEIDEKLIKASDNKIILTESFILELDSLSDQDKAMLESTSRLPKHIGTDTKKYFKNLDKIEKATLTSFKLLDYVFAQLQGEEIEIDHLIKDIKPVLGGNFLSFEDAGAISTLPVHIDEAKNITICLNQIFDLSKKDSEKHLAIIRKIAKFF